MDYTNWAKERQKLKDEILQELRTQRDRKAQTTIRGIIKFNPQIIGDLQTPVVIGPYRFGTSFLGMPSIAFANYPIDKSNPFIVDPFVLWDVQRGTVDGFYLGMYPVRQPAETLISHSIGWIAVGDAAVYKPSASVNKWQYTYDNSRANYLEGTT